MQTRLWWERLVSGRCWGDDRYGLVGYRGVLATSNIRNKDGKGHQPNAASYQPLLVTHLGSANASRLARRQRITKGH